jgi:hypothetical protein
MSVCEDFCKILQQYLAVIMATWVEVVVDMSASLIIEMNREWSFLWQLKYFLYMNKNLRNNAYFYTK